MTTEECAAQAIERLAEGLERALDVIAVYERAYGDHDADGTLIAGQGLVHESRKMAELLRA